jgi:sugar phosphate isomerase/epimerase
MSEIYVQPPDSDSFAEFLAFAKERSHNLEIASFAYSNVLDTNWEEILADHQQKLQGFEGVISLHGVIQEMIVHSRDKRIREVAEKRIRLNLEIAKALNARYVVFHGNFNPLIRQESYRRNWIERNAEFWSEVLDKYDDLTVLLENLWEPGPEVFKRLLEKAKSPRLKICFDTGHANVFSQVGLEEWLFALAENIAHVHVNDNDGEDDYELAPGEGNINWQEFSELLAKHRLAPNIVFEVGTLDRTVQSIEYFRKRNLYPFSARDQNRV